MKVLNQLLKKPSSAIVDDIPEYCPGCDSRHLQRIPRVFVDNLLGRRARYECRTCGATSLIVEQAGSEPPQPLESAESPNDDALRAEKLFRLGRKYASVAGAANKEKAALVCYLEAAKLGHTEAQYLAGLCLFSGLGTGRNVRLAHYWLGRAANSDHRSAQAMLPEVEAMLASLPKWEPGQRRVKSMARA